MVAEPFQGASIHTGIMTHQGGKVESPCPFRSIRRTNSGSYFLGTPARSARTWVTASQNSSSTFSLDRPTTSTLGTPASSRRTTLSSGQRVSGPPLLADGKVVEPVALVGVPQRGATLAGRDSRPPLRAPVRAVVGDLDRFHRRDAVVVLGEPVRLVAIEVYPFDAVGIPTAAVTTYAVVIAASQVRWLLDSVCQQPDGPSDKPVRDIVAGNWWRLTASLALQSHCEGDHYGNCFTIMDILASNF